MILLNFAHPLTPTHLAAIAQLTGQQIERVLDVKSQFDNARPFIEQARTLIEAVDLSPQEWQTAPLLVNLPSFNTIAALLLAEMHGRMGYFPAVLRLRPIAGSVPPQFQVAEIINLQAVREAARERR